MSPREQALVEAEPTFADLCDKVRETRRAVIRGVDLVDRLDGQLKEAKAELSRSHDAADVARDNLDDFIDRELRVEGHGSERQF